YSCNSGDGHAKIRALREICLKHVDFTAAQKAIQSPSCRQKVRMMKGMNAEAEDGAISWFQSLRLMIRTAQKAEKWLHSTSIQPVDQGNQLSLRAAGCQIIDQEANSYGSSQAFVRSLLRALASFRCWHQGRIHLSIACIQLRGRLLPER